MAGEVEINTSCNPFPIVGPSGTKPKLLYGIVVADTTVLTAQLAAAVPQYTFAICLSTKEIFVTEDNLNWQAYS